METIEEDLLDVDRVQLASMVRQAETEARDAGFAWNKRAISHDLKSAREDVREGFRRVLGLFDKIRREHPDIETVRDVMPDDEGGLGDQLLTRLLLLTRDRHNAETLSADDTT